MFTAGVVYLKDLMNENGKFYSHVEFQTFYGITINFLLYLSILHAIPCTYKENLNRNHPTNTISNLDRIMSTEKVPKYIYNSMIKIKSKFPDKAFAFHKKALSINIGNDIFISSFKLMYNCVSNTKLLDFQYRLLHNIITTNVQLKQWGLRENDTCTFCNRFPETISHLFLNCHISNTLWKELFEYINLHSGVHVLLDSTEEILGVREHQLSNFYNVICIITKQYIYACRCRNTRPSLSVLIEKIRFEKFVEKNIAMRESRIEIWQKKWELLSHLNFELNND